MKTKLPALLIITALLVCSGCATGRKGSFRPTPTPSLWPVQDENSSISSKFGLRGQGPATRHHNGVDINARKGAPVVATADGVVLFSGRAGSYGRAIKVSHGNGIETCYAHLRKCIAKKGRTVMQGDQIGKVGRSGKANGYHLHYEVRIYGAPTNPAPFLPAQPPKEQTAEK
ncbi:MAG: M23 family metallopeptidase [Candidatus Hydrogenedentes bacterium]|nr:M23 family metallopeptidase [Candidatus Hydrogenedentota bacterium]